MSQVIDSVPANFSEVFVCCYVNASSKIQIARVTNIANWYFERVVFPGQHLVFEAPAGALLEIHCGMMASAILSDTIPCDRLRMSKEEVLPFELSVQQSETPAFVEREAEPASSPSNESSVVKFMVPTSVAS
ncbi:MAG: DUF1830 domain-containing protein [Cyanothece sp. SIO2G6]|nr:DUF1830 domain-containing protein [Cyanothece sp. SIO2G6]